jgi:hypothetical protein
VILLKPEAFVVVEGDRFIRPSAQGDSMHVCAVRSSTVIRRCMAAWRWCGGPSTRKMDVLIFCGKEKKTSENSFSLVKYNILLCLS